jgi:beta-galactosidase
VQDADGRFVPDAAVDVTFAVKGPCELVATDNGDEADFTSFHSPTRRTFAGRLQAIVRLKPGAAGASITASASGLAPCEIPVRR